MSKLEQLRTTAMIALAVALTKEWLARNTAGLLARMERAAEDAVFEVEVLNGHTHRRQLFERDELSKAPLAVWEAVVSTLQPELETALVVPVENRAGVFFATGKR